MAPATTESRPATHPPAQPSIMKRYSPHGECPISFTGSALVHVLALLVLAGGLWINWRIGSTESSRPPKMDMVEIEGGGGGLGNIGSGPGAGDPGSGSRKENVEAAKTVDQPKPLDFAQSQLKLPIKEPAFPQLDANPVVVDDPFASIPIAQAQARAWLEKDLNVFKGGVGDGKGIGHGSDPGTGSGGVKGKGLGPKQGPGTGKSPVGGVLNDQRKRELRWQILAGTDPDVHLKKLQALKVILIVPLNSRPGRVLRYDLSKPGLNKEEISAKDESDKVRWMNRDQKEMFALARGLGLSEIPPYAVIYLPTELEHTMAKEELANGRKEWEIRLTIWDVKRFGDQYDNVPSIHQQILWSDMK